VCHALVTEDDFLIAIYIQMVLEENGATSVEVVSTEREAIQTALTKRPGVITSDINGGERIESR
jgi:CheY-like chemotaxis protein